MEFLESIKNIAQSIVNNNSWMGVIGTLLGTILGWVLNSVSKSGSIKIYVYDWEDSPYRKECDRLSNYSYKAADDSKTFIRKDKCKNMEDADGYEYGFSVDIYNSSESTKIMRNIRIIFCRKHIFGTEKLVEDIPKDYDTKRQLGNYYYYDPVSPINVSPKCVKKLRLGNEIQKTTAIKLRCANRVYLFYVDEKNRHKIAELKKGSYQKFFEQQIVEDKNGQTENAHAE